MEGLSRLDRVMSVLLTLATVVAAGILVTDRLFPSTSTKAIQRIEYVDNWQEQVDALGVPLDGVKPVNVAVFTDFQCPFCKRMDSTLARIVAKEPSKVGRTVIHFPIPTHQFAQSAATAFECAAEQGQAREMHRALYEQQSQIGVTGWSVFARSAGVLDTNRFQMCIADTSRTSRIASGFALGRKLGITGTPVVVINGWLFDPAFPEMLEDAIADAINGRKPKH